MYTHETYINDIVKAAKTMVANDPAKLKAIEQIKVVYGLGSKGLRGVTYYEGWQGKDKSPMPVIEVCAFGQENWTQVAGTTIHELGHVIAGYGSGHGPEWKKACEGLGLRNPMAAGHKYLMSGFDPKLRSLIIALPTPQDGSPKSVAGMLGIPIKPKACTMGVGTKGGKSRGTGSGSRLVKCQCDKCGYNVRTTGKWLAIAIPSCPDTECDMFGKPMTVEA